MKKTNRAFHKFLKQNRSLLTTLTAVLTFFGTLVTLMTLPKVSWSEALVAMLVLSWIMFGTILVYNKLNKLASNISSTKRNPEPGEYIYIEGEDEAMSALIAATKRARKSIRSTRFFPCPIRGRHDTYSSAIRGRVLGEDGEDPIRVYYRIVACNKPEKIEDVKEYIRAYYGKPFKLFLTHKSNSFELVVIDEEEVFIHFYGKDSVIGSTIYLPGNKTALKFRDVFDRLKDINFDETIMVVDCEYIRENQIEDWIGRIAEYFDQYTPPAHKAQGEIERLLDPEAEPDGLANI